MNKMFAGLAVIAACLASPAEAGPPDADLWVGVGRGDDGFLIDEDTGDMWMTGACLKPLAQARRDGDAWISNTVELVSVGRAKALLDQTFVVETDPDAPAVTVRNADRGGAQRFTDVVVVRCADSGACAARAQAPIC